MILLTRFRSIMLWFDVENDSNYRFYCRSFFLYSKISSILSQSKYPDAKERCHRILTKWQENGIDDVSGMDALTSLVTILRDVKCYQLAGIYKYFDVIDHRSFTEARALKNDSLLHFRHTGEGIWTLENAIGLTMFDNADRPRDVTDAKCSRPLQTMFFFNVITKVFCSC